MRFFGAAVESESVNRKREELELVAIERQIRKMRVESVTESVSIGLRALQDLGLPIDDRDRMRAKDMINQATFETPGSSVALQEDANQREICIRQFLQEHGHRKSSLDIQLGISAKKLLLKENPAYIFPKKQIYANGQMLQANLWYESQKKYLEAALTRLIKN